MGMKPNPMNTDGSHQSTLMDQTALEASNVELQYIYTKHFPAVKQYILKNSGDEDDARDIYQEAFVAFWRNQTLGKFEAIHEGAIGAYILKIAKFKWIDQLRKKKASPITFDNNEALWQADGGIDEQESEYLNKVVAHFSSLGEPCKELLYRFYYLKEKLRVIASKFSWTEATAKNNKYRCLQKLRSAVLQAQSEDI